MLYFWPALLYLLVVNVLGYTAPYYDLENAEKHFADFIEQYEKKYESAAEHQKRFEIFKENLKNINNWNDYFKHDKGGYKVTQFSDQHNYKSCAHAFKPTNRTHFIQVKREFIVNAPEHLDYRHHNLVTEIKNQGSHCGSCYAFAAIGNIEGMHAKATGELISLSEQQVLDCDNKDGGCKGGNEIRVIESLASQGGCMSEKDYPYVHVKGTCHADQSKIKVKVLGVHVMETPDVETLKGALYQNGAPLAIHLFASFIVTHSYGPTILNPIDCQHNETNHAALLVGYSKDATSGRPYWIIKNAWGPYHGDKGYSYIDMENKCSVAKHGAITSSVQ